MPQLTDVFAARILIVDDQESNVKLLEFTLRRGGYLCVESTTDPLAVSEMHRTNPYDVILLDLQMPHMNGFQVLEVLRSESSVAVLILSADAAQMVRTLEAGATGFLGKPFVLAEVLARVHFILNALLAAPEGVPAPASSGTQRS